MTELELRNLLLVGMDNAALARSAKNAGHGVYAVDYFGDQDLRWFSDDLFLVVDQREGGSGGRLDVDFNAEALLDGAKKISGVNHIDAILMSTGLDDSIEVLHELKRIAPIIGNSPELTQRVRDREKFFRDLKHLGVPAPKTAVVDGLSEARRASNDIGYPLLLKPVEGFGGAGIKRVDDSEELSGSFRRPARSGQGIVVQEYIRGMPASASVVSAGNESVTLTVNEQIIGLNTYGQIKPFGYCGNIVPLAISEDVMARCKELAGKIVTHFGLVGSNGVDFVISEDGVPHVVEVNPRFQGTLECVERVLGMNLVEVHVKAVTKGLLPKVPNLISGSCTRLILFAPHRSVVPDLSRCPEVRDVPYSGVVIEKGEPVCSIVAEGKDRDSSFDKAKCVADMVRGVFGNDLENARS